MSLKSPFSSDDTVYNGIWTNWERGKVLGATLTTDSNYGLILISFLTLFVQFSGACFWRVLCFIIHQNRSTTDSKNGLFHQQQVILRNAIAAPNALWKMGRSAFVWKGRIRAPIRNSLPLIILTAFHIAVFTAAGLFSSRVTGSSNSGQALVRGKACGFPPAVDNLRAVSTRFLSGKELLDFNTQVLLGRMTLAKSAAYVRSCYSENDNTASGGCNFFVQPFLESDRASEYVNSSCTCPFGNNACTKDPICFDSGAISSSKDLGINLPETETMTVRRVTTCAPIDADRYATPWIDNVAESLRDGDAPSNTSVRYYQMGKGKEGCFNLADEWYQKNEIPEDNLTTTFCVAKSSRRYLPSAYTIAAQTVYVNKEDASDFTPIPDFAPVESDVTLMSLLNKADYTQEVDDPLFFAHNKSVVSAEATFLTASHDLSVLGCTEKYQICNTANRLCTPLTGQYAVRQSIANNTLQLSPQQTATFALLSDGIWAMSLQWAFKVLGADLLLAKDWIYTIDSSGSSGLPPDQWHREVENLHNMSLATLQRRIAEFANPSAFDVSPDVSSIEQIRNNTPADPLLRRLCELQKIRSSNHYSVSVLGMAIILGVGSVLILLDWVFIQQIFWWRGGSRLAKRMDWQSTGTLQLYRLALEARGVGPWDSHDYDFPVLMDGEKKFRPLTEAEGGAEMARLDPNQRQQYGYGGGYVNNFGGNTAYDGGKYSALPSQKGSETDVKVGEAK